MPFAGTPQRAYLKSENGKLRSRHSCRTTRHALRRSFCADSLRKPPTAVRCCLNALRAEPIPRHAEEAWDEAMLWLHEIAAECDMPSRRIELAEFQENLTAALGKLPPRVAQVFQLYAVEQRPNAEVCQKLNISQSNLWVMLHRARKQLRDHLHGWWEAGTPVLAAPQK